MRRRATTPWPGSAPGGRDSYPPLTPFAAVVLLVAVALVALGVYGSRPLWNGESTPPPKMLEAPAPGARLVLGQGGTPREEVLAPVAVDDPRAAAFAAAFVHQLMSARSDGERRRVADLFVLPGQRVAVLGLANRWLERLGRETGAALPSAPVVTLGYRITDRASNGGAERTQLLLWLEQRGASTRVRGRPPATTYVVTRLTVERQDGELLVVGIDGVFPGPRPQPGQELFFRPVGTS